MSYRKSLIGLSLFLVAGIVATAKADASLFAADREAYARNRAALLLRAAYLALRAHFG